MESRRFANHWEYDPGSGTLNDTRLGGDVHNLYRMPKVRVLLEALLDDHGRRIDRSRLVDAVWPGERNSTIDRKHKEHKLNQLVYRLRKLLGSAAYFIDTGHPGTIGIIDENGCLDGRLALPDPQPGDRFAVHRNVHPSDLEDWLDLPSLLRRQAD